LQRKAERQTLVEHAQNTFGAIAREWFAMLSPTWAESHGGKIIRRLEREVFPWLGSKPVNQITAPELLAVLRRIEARGFKETAHRTMQHDVQLGS
jgi:integrase